jgi:hypothetical protein
LKGGLDAETLLAHAREVTGLEDMGEDGWREGLERLIDALEREAALSQIGEVVASTEITGYLVNRLHITDWHQRHPEIGASPVAAPVVIVGQARTGTTILHDLLAQDPAVRVPLTWEVDRPHPPPERATYDDDPRIAEVQQQLEASELLIPGFLAMHPLGAQLAQECVRMTAADFRSMIFPTVYRVPSYAGWLLHEADMASAYRWHRRYLQLLQWRHPAERWVLKSPGHIWSLEALMAEYPDAVLVQTHRDPVRIVASLASLMALLRRMASDEVSITDIASQFCVYILDGLDRSVRARDDGTVPPDQVVDVQFADFMRDPMSTIRTVYERVGDELPPAIEARMHAFLETHSREAHGSHEYTFADTGLDEGEVRARAADYVERFEVPSEPAS